MDLLEHLKARGFVEQVTDEKNLNRVLAQGPITAYIGFDPTADSLHCGSLVPLMALAHLQRAGHRVIAIIGGGTGLIGDPSGKTELRQVLTREQIAKNLQGLRRQIERFVKLDGERGFIIDNAEWLCAFSYIEFLRDIGRHFTVNRMLAAKTYKERFEGENGLNFIEFNYQLLQAYDFLHLFRSHGCQLQMGGNDQWGNICAGVDLTRRVAGAEEVFGVTFPLITTSNGVKMGKTAAGAVWLDPARTSAHDFYQYWRDGQDSDVARFLKLFTFLPLIEIEDLTAQRGAALNEAKRRLAFEITSLVHGAAAAEQERAAEQGEVGALPTVVVNKREFEGEGLGILDACTRIAGLAKSNGEVRRAIEHGGLYVNELPVTDPFRRLTLADFDPHGVLVLGFGKKKKKRLALQS